MRKLLIVFFAMMLATGCQSTKGPTQKEQATTQWNNARASVMAGLAKDQYETGSFEKSRQTVNEALRLEPTNANLHLLSAKLAIESGQTELADQELKAARTLDPKNAEADYLSGVIAQRWQKTQAALEFYTAAAEKQPTELAYVLAEAEMLVALSRSPDALVLLQTKLPDFEHNGVIRDAIGQLLMQQSRWDEASASFREAAILNSEDSTIREHLGLSLYFAGKYRESADVIGHLLKDDAYAKRTDLITALGECQMRTSKFRDAKASFETAAELNAASAKCWLNLSKASIAVGDLPRADLAIRKAMSIDPASGESQLMLGYLRLRENRLADALAAFRKANELQKDDSVSLCMIGFVLEKTGHADQALGCYSQALKLKPKDELATKLMARVEPRE